MTCSGCTYAFVLLSPCACTLLNDGVDLNARSSSVSDLTLCSPGGRRLGTVNGVYSSSFSILCTWHHGHDCKSEQFLVKVRYLCNSIKNLMLQQPQSRRGYEQIEALIKMVARYRHVHTASPIMNLISLGLLAFAAMMAAGTNSPFLMHGSSILISQVQGKTPSGCLVQNCHLFCLCA